VEGVNPSLKLKSFSYLPVLSVARETPRRLFERPRRVRFRVYLFGLRVNPSPSLPRFEASNSIPYFVVSLSPGRSLGSCFNGPGGYTAESISLAFSDYQRAFQPRIDQCRTVSAFTGMFIYIYICISICLSIYLFIYLSICLPI